MRAELDLTGPRVAIKKKKIVKYLMIVTVHVPRIIVHEPYKKGHGKLVKSSRSLLYHYIFLIEFCLP